MKRLIALSTLLSILVIKLLAPAVYALMPSIASEASGGSCREPSTGNTDRCAQLEAQILSSTARVYFETWVMAPDESGYLMYDSVGHATVKDGRYLVTHNHTEIPLSIRHRAGDPDAYTTVFLYDAAGALRYQGTLADFTIVMEDAETLVLAHKESDFFGSLGFNSAQFKNWEDTALRRGLEVAQIDWDGELARVDWVRIGNLIAEQDVPRITLEKGTTVGASGGGIFIQGYHIGNNWRVEEQLDGAGDVISQTTTVALNSRQVAG